MLVKLSDFPSIDLLQSPEPASKEGDWGNPKTTEASHGSKAQLLVASMARIGRIGGKTTLSYGFPLKVSIKMRDSIKFPY